MNEITVVIPVSPIISHPDTAIIDECIATVRQQLPDAEIILTFDGVHESQQSFTPAYTEYKTRMMWKCLHEYTNVLPVIFQSHHHQSGMMKAVMDKITTPLLLYVEGDTMLVDREIDWEACRSMIITGKAHTIRFHFEAEIPKPHETLMVGEVEDGFLRTVQWSQRPHLASKAYYEWMMADFPNDAQSFIEDHWYGRVISDWNEHGITGWNLHRLWIYYPEGNIKTSYTRDGRQGTPKVGEGFKR